jgi:hypothetical protein
MAGARVQVEWGTDHFLTNKKQQREDARSGELALYGRIDAS